MAQSQQILPDKQKEKLFLSALVVLLLKGTACSSSE
jgi:hypothetical protein